MKSDQIPVISHILTEYGPVKTPYMDTFHPVISQQNL